MSNDSTSEDQVDDVGDPKERRSRQFNLSVKDIVILIGGLVGILTFAGQWFVYGDKVKTGEARHILAEAESKARVERLTVVEQWQKAADPVLIQMRAHVADRSIHTTAEDAKAHVALQLQPFLVGMEGVKADVENQQKQLDRIEELLKEMRTKQVATAGP